LALKKLKNVMAPASCSNYTSLPCTTPAGELNRTHRATGLTRRHLHE
jgi:hypothetical protein